MIGRGKKKEKRGTKGFFLLSKETAYNL